jgi:hypothetical protein
MKVGYKESGAKKKVLICILHNLYYKSLLNHITANKSSETDANHFYYWM